MNNLPQIPQDIIDNNRALSEWNILTAFRGSITHGTYRPNSDPNSIDDIDTISICIPSLSHYWGLDQFGSRGTQEIKLGVWDMVIYDMHKLIRLLIKANPNVLSLLWLRPEHYIDVTPAGELLLEQRNLFSTTKVYHSFMGYAHSQLKKMTTTKYMGYMGAKRKELVDKYGYDTKNASHLIRLLNMGIEFLHTGHMSVYREHDFDYLLAIKRGAFSLDFILSEAKDMFADIKTARQLSNLPDEVDYDAVNDLTQMMIKTELKRRGEI